MGNKLQALQIVLDADRNQCNVASQSQDPWEDMAICLEGLGVIIQACINAGIPQQKVYDEVKNYFMKVTTSVYEVKTIKPENL